MDKKLPKLQPPSAVPITALAILLAVYFLLRLLFKYSLWLKINGFIVPTGAIVKSFLGYGYFTDIGEWIYDTNSTQFILGESCSGTTFFSLLTAYIAFRIQTSGASYLWLLAVLPITIIVNAMRVVSSIAVHNMVSHYNFSGIASFAHVASGVAVFLCCFLIVAYFVERTGKSGSLNGY